MKFRVHLWEHVRHVYEVEADNMDQVVEKVEALDLGKVIELQPTGDFADQFLVDPLFPDGGVDYRGTRYFSGEDAE